MYHDVPRGLTKLHRGFHNFLVQNGLKASLFLTLAALLFCAPLRAQETSGPLAGTVPQTEDDTPLPPVQIPAPRQLAAAPAPQPPPARPALPQSDQVSKDAPSVPVDQIIQKFAEHEAEFRAERENFTYVQDFTIETLDSGGRADGAYEETTDITYPNGKRDEHVTYAPPNTLQRIMLSEQDLDDLRNVQPFVLTTEELPKYDVTYVGRQKVDELGTYVFDVAPKRLEKNQRYFQGRIWVDDRDLEIVKTYGKAVPDIRKGNSENVFPRFETYRENIEGNYWFPTYTHSDDVLHFRTSDVHIRMIVHYSDYKRFRVSIKLLNTEPASTPSQTPPPPPPAPPKP
jgi:hypothetical protein